MSIAAVKGPNAIATAPVAPQSNENIPAGDTEDMMPPPALQQLLGSGDMGAQMSALVMMAAKQQRDGARELRRHEESAEEIAQKNELEAMREAADDRRDGAIFQGLAQCTSGAAGIAAGSMQVQGANADRAYVIANPGQNAPANGWSGAAEGVQGFGGVANGVGTIGKGMYDHAAAGHDIEAKAAANEASTAKRAIDDARDLEKDAKDLMNRVMSFYKEYVTSKEDATKAALHRA